MKSKSSKFKCSGCRKRSKFFLSRNLKGKKSDSPKHELNLLLENIHHWFQSLFLSFFIPREC